MSRSPIVGPPPHPWQNIERGCPFWQRSRNEPSSWRERFLQRIFPSSAWRRRETKESSIISSAGARRRRDPKVDAGHTSQQLLDTAMSDDHTEQQQWTCCELQGGNDDKEYPPVELPTIEDDNGARTYEETRRHLSAHARRLAAETRQAKTLRQLQRMRLEDPEEGNGLRRRRHCWWPVELDGDDGNAALARSGPVAELDGAAIEVGVGSSLIRTSGWRYREGGWSGLPGADRGESRRHSWSEGGYYFPPRSFTSARPASEPFVDSKPVDASTLLDRRGSVPGEARQEICEDRLIGCVLATDHAGLEVLRVRRSDGSSTRDYHISKCNERKESTLSPSLFEDLDKFVNIRPQRGCR
ncbi:MAG: hypothetical protein Q9219_000697 [cf. Caloplaca sp. 3 TL-2023]